MTQQNIELGPCRVRVNDTDVGRTIGPVRVSVGARWREQRSDRYGAAILDRVALGTEVRVTLRLAEKTLANLQRALPQTSAGDGYQSLGRSPGFKAASAAQSLRLSPEERSSTGRDILLHKAVASGAIAVAYGPGRTRSFEVEFIALLDTTREDGDWLARLYQAD